MVNDVALSKLYSIFGLLPPVSRLDAGSGSSGTLLACMSDG